MINSVVLVGRITRDLELMKNQNGTSYCRFTVACNRRSSRDAGGQQADFISCTAWGRTAETMCQYLRKGALVGVEGRISTSSYDNAQGQRVYRTEVWANNVTFLESRNAREANWNDQGGYSQPQSYSQPSYSNSSYGQPQPAFNSYQSRNTSANNVSNPGNDAFAPASSTSFDDAFGDDFDIATDDLPF